MKAHIDAGGDGCLLKIEDLSDSNEVKYRVYEPRLSCLSEGKMPTNQSFRILNITAPNDTRVQLRTYRKMLEGPTNEYQLPAIAGTAF